MPRTSVESRREYNREYRLKRGDELLALKRDNSKRQHSDRKDLLADCTCISCHSLDPTTTQWHHVDPSSKSFNIFRMGGVSEERFWNEVLKCVPLCANCHLKLHTDKLCLLPIPR